MATGADGDAMDVLEEHYGYAGVRPAADRIGEPVREDDAPYELPDPTYVPQEPAPPRELPVETPLPERVPA